MTQAYSNPKRASDPHALPNIEVFYLSRKDCDALDRAEESRINDPRVIEGGGGEWTSPGWYWQACYPGCLPDGEPIGPFDTEAEALADAQDDAYIPAPCSVCGSADICCGDAESGLCAAHCKSPVRLQSNDSHPTGC